MKRVVWQEFVCCVIVIIHPLVLEGESEKWRILHIIAASGTGVKPLQALYTISSSFGPLARYLIIFSSPGHWRWDLNILANLQFMNIQLVCFHHDVLSRCRFSSLKRDYRN